MMVTDMNFTGIVKIVRQFLKKFLLAIKKFALTIFNPQNISKGIGYSAMFAGGMIVTSTIFTYEVEKYAATALSYLAIIAVLSSLCYSASQNTDNPEHKAQLRLGGERFFHAVLLII